MTAAEVLGLAVSLVVPVGLEVFVDVDVIVTLAVSLGVLVDDDVDVPVTDGVAVWVGDGVILPVGDAVMVAAAVLRGVVLPEIVVDDEPVPV